MDVEAVGTAAEPHAGQRPEQRATPVASDRLVETAAVPDLLAVEGDRRVHADHRQIDRPVRIGRAREVEGQLVPAVDDAARRPTPIVGQGAELAACALLRRLRGRLARDEARRTQHHDPSTRVGLGVQPPEQRPKRGRQHEQEHPARQPGGRHHAATVERPARALQGATSHIRGMSGTAARGLAV
jgi:hypothetical protein